MNHYAYFYSLVALDIAHERSREAEQSWLAASLVATGSAPRSTVRRAAATVLAVISRGAATAARRLDSRVDDDLRRSLAPAK